MRLNKVSIYKIDLEKAKAKAKTKAKTKAQSIFSLFSRPSLYTVPPYSLPSFLLFILLFQFETGCVKASKSYSLLADSQSFQQVESETFDRKVDVLWVIDNSGSMATSQSNVAENFTAFIEDFEQTKYDFHMAVTTTDAYRSLFTGKSQQSVLKSSILTAETPLIKDEFIKAINQGIAGNGDERAFESIKQTLENPSNKSFRREGAFLSIIIVSDEDDFSHPNAQDANHDYNRSDLYSVQSYYDYLAKITKSTETQLNFSVSAITIDSDFCYKELSDQWPGRIIGIRYLELANLTKGVKASLCGDFAESLKNISRTIMTLSSVFYLTRVPLENTIRVSVNNNNVVQNSTNGWSYNSVNNSIEFHGSAIPKSGDTLNVDFDPSQVKE